jgi:hypothetical protein
MADPGWVEHHLEAQPNLKAAVDSARQQSGFVILYKKTAINFGIFCFAKHSGEDYIIHMMLPFAKPAARRPFSPSRGRMGGFALATAR